MEHARVGRRADACPRAGRRDTDAGAAPGAAPAPAPGAAPLPGAAPAPPPPSPEELRAERERTAKAQIDKLLSGGTEHLPELEKLLTRWSADEEDPVAKSSRTLARARLLELAQTDLQKEDFVAAKAHYRIGVGVFGPSEETTSVLELVKKSAIDAIKAGDAEKAVVWAREGLTLGGQNAEAHALLADTLYAAKQYKDSVDEYRLALAGKPEDETLKRGLDRARKKAGPDKPARPRAKARVAKSAGAADSARRRRARRGRGQERAVSAVRDGYRRAEVAASPARDHLRSSAARRAASASAGSSRSARPRTSRRRCAGSSAAAPR